MAEGKRYSLGKGCSYHLKSTIFIKKYIVKFQLLIFI